MKNRIIIENEQEYEPFLRETQNLIIYVVDSTLKIMGVAFSAEVSVTLTDDDVIHELNLKHRSVDRPTDVLSFPQYTAQEIDSFDENDHIVLGDIVISAQRARAQAIEYGHSYTREMAFLTVHSVLHLLGYDHMTEEEEKVMFSLQSRILDTLGIIRK